MPELSLDEQLYIELADVDDDPYTFVLSFFPWGEGQLAKFKGPDKWQIDVLLYIRDEIRNGRMSAGKALDLVVQIAVASGHGIGKSALVAWMILWALSTFEDTRGIVTANTDTQLKTKTWPELSKWFHMFRAKHLFCLTATSIYSATPDHQRTWRIDIIPWSINNTDAFAGLHNQGKRIILIFDEASSIADKIWEVAEGALTDSDTEIIWIAFGNPTMNTGRFRECFRKYRHRWATMQVDSREVEITNKNVIAQRIDDYGIDSDYVKVRILGQFPSSSDRQMIPTDLAMSGRGRHLRPEMFNFAPVILGVDPAWTGGDETVIYLRQGLFSKRLAAFPRNDDDTYIAGVVAMYEDEYHADAVFIDLGWGTGIYSAGKNVGRQWSLVSFGSAAPDAGYVNLRAYMWAKGKEWLKQGGSYPEDDQIMQDDLISPEVIPRPDGKILLESKESMKDRGLPSPNRADALFLTFAMPVAKKNTLLRGDGGKLTANTDWKRDQPRRRGE